MRSTLNFKKQETKNGIFFSFLRILRLFSLIVSALLLIYACEKDEPLDSSLVADFEYVEELDEFYLSDFSSNADGTPLNYKWSAEPQLILFSNTDQPETFFRIPVLEAPRDLEVSLTISDGRDSDTRKKTLTLPVLTESRLFGLGVVCTSENSSDVEHEWYFDQANSGLFSNINCGPASATMAIKWAQSSFTGTVQDARNMYLPSGGWWYTNNIIDYLNHHGVTNYTLNLTNMNVITNEIDNGNIAILCLDMYFIRNQEKDRWRVDRFYNANSAGWGHFIIAKGYKVVDDKLFFEVYDPYGFGQVYEDGSPKGKNRFYRGEEIDYSSNIWWDYTIIVTRDALKSGVGIDPATIPHKPGR